MLGSDHQHEERGAADRLEPGVATDQFDGPENREVLLRYGAGILLWRE
jgi:hypothetical protein